MENQIDPVPPDQPPEPQNGLSTRDISILVAILIVIVLAVFSSVYYLFSITGRPVPSLSADTNSFPAAILPSESPAQISRFSLCQPESFDPQSAVFTPYIPTPGESVGKKTLFEIKPDQNNDQQYLFSQSVEKIAGFSLNIYEFICGSSSDFVIDVQKNGERINLLSLIDAYYVSAANQLLYINSYTPNKGGALELTQKLFSVDSNKEITLPAKDCVSRFAVWSGKNLITYSDQNADTKGLTGDTYQNYQTKICVWDTAGNLLRNFQKKLTWYGVNTNHLWGSVGLLPKDPDIFYIYDQNYSASPPMCSLFLMDLNPPSKQLILNLFPESGTMPQHLCPPGSDIDLDLTAVTFTKFGVRFRVTGSFLNQGYENLAGWQQFKASPQNPASP